VASGLAPPGGYPQVMGQLAAEGALDDGFLEATDGGVEFRWCQRPRSNELIKNLGWHGRQQRLRLGFGFSATRETRSERAITNHKSEITNPIKDQKSKITNRRLTIHQSLFPIPPPVPPPSPGD
jgi:hypothetical protein